MNNQAPPPPPPPPHGARNQQQQQQSRSSNLPPGNYDIFVIPPHSSGSGFLYLPSLQPHRNSFLAGVVCTLTVIGVWILVEPVLKQWASTVFANGGSGILILVLGVGVLGWAAGKTQMENTTAGSGPAGGGQQPDGAGSDPAGGHQTNTSGAHSHSGSYGAAGSPPPFGAAEGARANPKPSWQRPNPSAGWEKAREEMRKKEEDRKKRDEADKKAKEAAEKQKWEQSRQREREQREKEARERVAQERLKRERELKEQREKQEREAREKERAAKAAQEKPHHSTNYKKPTASSFVSTDEAYSYRPYDRKQPPKTGSQSSFVSGSEGSSWTGSQSTARTTPPPSHRAPYVNKDPDKITIRAVFMFTDALPGKPFAQLISGMGSVTDGLVLKMTSEGLFIDDDVRGVPQREWDVKAWTMKLVESGDLRGKHVLRASIRDAENKKYVFVIDEPEAWKVAVGLQRLRRGSQVRSLGVSGMSVGEMTGILKMVGC